MNVVYGLIRYTRTHKRREKIRSAIIGISTEMHV